MTTTESDFDSSPVQQDANSRISVDESPLETNFQFIGKNIPYGVYLVVTHLVPNSFGPHRHLVPIDKWSQSIWSPKTLGPQDKQSPWTNGPHHILSPWTSGPQIYKPLLSFKHLFLKQLELLWNFLGLQRRL